MQCLWMIIKYITKSQGEYVNIYFYNVFIYADDLLLISTTVSGLQTFIKCANHYITEHGPAFNASKTSCVIFGKCYFEQPKWFLNETELKCDNEMKYLGAILSKKYHTYQQERLKASRKAFYGLQGNRHVCQ